MEGTGPSTSPRSSAMSLPTSPSMTRLGGHRASVVQRRLQRVRVRRPRGGGSKSLWLATVSGNLLPLAGLERLSGEHRHWPTRRVPISSDTCCAWRTASAFACSRPRRLGRSRCGGAQVSYGVSLAEAQTSGSPLRSPVFPYGHSYSGAVASGSSPWASLALHGIESAAKREPPSTAGLWTKPYSSLGRRPGA